MKRGYSAIGLFSPKNRDNVGGTIRAAGIYGASLVVIEGARQSGAKIHTDTMKSYKHIPTLTGTTLTKAIPAGCSVVVVDLIDGAEPLPVFTHPERAFYIFGPEDGTLGSEHTSIADHVVYVPGNRCMNLAASVNVVLYDRIVKRNEWI